MAGPAEAATLINGLDLFAGLSADDRMILASRARIETLPRRSILFRQDEDDPWLLCLLEGSLELVARDGRTHRTTADESSGVTVLSRLKPRLYTATAATPIRVLRIDEQGLGNWHRAADPASVHLEEIVDEAAADPPGMDDRQAALSRFELPTIPAVALRARRLLERDDVDVEAIARVVMSDPSVAAKLIRAANSPMFYGKQSVATCERAIVRLGLRTARHLVLAFGMRALFEMDNPTLAPLVAELWAHSTRVAAIAQVIAARTGVADPGEAQLAGLVHDIGIIPVLNHAGRAPDRWRDADAIVAFAARQRAVLGPALLESWHFPEPVVAAARDAEDWWRDTPDNADLADLIVVSQLVGFIGTERILEVPPLHRVSALGRVFGEGFDQHEVLVMLEEVDGELETLQSILRG